MLADTVASHNFLEPNVGEVPSFQRGDGSLVIDVTFYRGVEVTDWRVLKEVFLTATISILSIPSVPHQVMELHPMQLGRLSDLPPAGQPKNWLAMPFRSF